MGQKMKYKINAAMMSGAAVLGTVPVAFAGNRAGFQDTDRQGRPNVVFILADDMGQECIGCYGSTYSTPNIDALASEGIMFTYAYSQPLSTPSRVELMTGKYNHRNYSEFGFLNHDQKTFGNMAREAGYRTCIAGKWQLGSNNALPDHFGFDNYCLWQLTYERGRNAERYARPLIEADGQIVSIDNGSYGPDIFAGYIKDWIKENKDDPFFVYYPMVLTHSPFVVTPDSEDWARDEDGRYRHDPKYFPDMVEYCDKIVGDIVTFLKAEGLYDNTLVIFTGDNGTGSEIRTAMKDGSVIRGGKGETTDAGTHTAMVATFGSRQAPHYVCGDLIDFTDILPTFAEAFGYKGEIGKDGDGMSFLHQIEGKKGKTRKWVFCHYDSFFRGAAFPEKRAKRYIRDHRYKLYSTGEFYDICSDPLEKSPVPEGTGTPSAEKSRKFLSRQLAKFPAWKVGDIPVQKVEHPDYRCKKQRYKPNDR